MDGRDFAGISGVIKEITEAEEWYLLLRAARNAAALFDTQQLALEDRALLAMRLHAKKDALHDANGLPDEQFGVFFEEYLERIVPQESGVSSR